jgi:hypothetical protein
MAISNIQTAGTTGVGSVSATVTQNSGNNRILIAAGTQKRSPPNLTGLTYNGVAGTQAVSIDNGTQARTVICYWLDADLPATGGSYTLAAVGPSIYTELGLEAFSCSGAEQAAPTDTDSAGTTGSSISFSMTMGAGGVALLFVTADNTLTAGGSQTAILASTYTGSWEHAASYKTADGNISYSQTSAAYAAGAVAINEASAGGLSITSVTPATFDDGRTGVVIAGSGFGASQGSSTVTIGGVAQTVTAWSATSITITTVRSSQSMGAASLTVTIV